MVNFENKGTAKQINKFAACIAKLTPEEFLGVCKLMNVPFYVEKEVSGEKVETAEINEQSVNTEEQEEENKKAKLRDDISMRPAEEIINDMISKFGTWNRVKRRNLMGILEAATKKRK